jgi:hypothetical protein
MSVITWPSTITVEKFSWMQQRRDVYFNSIFGSQAIEVSPPQWSASITPLLVYEKDAGDIETLLMQLKGRTNQLALHNLARPAPLGTMRGTMTFNTAPSAGDTTISVIAATEAGKTLLKGDLIGFGSGATQQVVMVLADATADGSGIISLSIEPPLRNAFSAGDSITWDAPKALFRYNDQNSSNGQTGTLIQWDYEMDMISGIVIPLIEDWRT